ncbi:MAG TPA: homocysteine S-methyltransferase family protein, partial [Bacteroidota bacterium]|nr:homocysteine S-methyltransferase family protein [Bacteroidota bacterium]
SSAAHGSERGAGPLAELFRRRRPAILDGAMGTELARRGADTGLPLWSAGPLETAPDAVKRILADYIAAGADIITTDTFRTTRRTFRRAAPPDRSGELTALAVALARDARQETGRGEVLIAGSIGPLEDCYHPELVPPDPVLHEEHAEIAGRLADAGVDFILIETMGTTREAYAAAVAAGGTGLEFIVSLICRRDGALYGGEPVAEAVRRIAPLKPAAFSINCVSARFMAEPLARLRAALSETHGAEGIPVGVYANVGLPGGESSMVDSQSMIENVEPKEYASLAAAWARSGVALIGGCCGTRPEHIRAVARSLGRHI